MMSKDELAKRLNALMDGATDYEKWTLTKALKAVQNTVTDTGIPGALMNVLYIPDVLPKLTVKVRQEVLKLINQVDAIRRPSDSEDDN